MDRRCSIRWIGSSRCGRRRERDLVVDLSWQVWCFFLVRLVIVEGILILYTITLACSLVRGEARSALED